MDNPETIPSPDLSPDSPPAGGEQSPSLLRRAFRMVADVLETLLMALILFLVVNLVSERIRVDGQSMEPSLETGQLVLVNKLAYRLGEPATGDIVVFYFPRDPDQEYIKRLIGLPGDSVKIQDGTVYINGQTLHEPYLAIHPNYAGDWMVPEGQVFVLGDNRNNSSDSHRWGTVPLDYIVGKALLVYWPLSDWKILDIVPEAQAAEK